MLHSKLNEFCSAVLEKKLLAIPYPPLSFVYPITPMLHNPSWNAYTPLFASSNQNPSSIDSVLSLGALLRSSVAGISLSVSIRGIWFCTLCSLTSHLLFRKKTPPKTLSLYPFGGPLTSNRTEVWTTGQKSPATGRKGVSGQTTGRKGVSGQKVSVYPI